MNTYEVLPHGDRYGFRGWVTVYRNSQPVRHFPTNQDANDWISEQHINMCKYEVVPYTYWRRDDGQTASVHGALPYKTDAESLRWTIVEDGFTLYNPLTNEYGIGRKPWSTREEAQAHADTYKPSRICIGD